MGWVDGKTFSLNVGHFGNCYQNECGKTHVVQVKYCDTRKTVFIFFTGK